MGIETVLWVLIALAAVVVLLTRLRLHANQAQAGRAQVSDTLVNLHTGGGLVMLVLASYYLSSPNGLLGYLAAVAWWAEAVLGLAILARWLPAGGRHSAAATDDNWAQGPFLSILGHVGMVLGAVFFTFSVVADKVS